MIEGLLYSLTVNSSVTKLLVKWTDDHQSVGISVAQTVVFLLPKEMQRGTTVGVCIKENEIDYVGGAVLDENE
jgi:hypothetical protein